MFPVFLMFLGDWGWSPSELPHGPKNIKKTGNTGIPNGFPVFFNKNWKKTGISLGIPVFPVFLMFFGPWGISDV